MSATPPAVQINAIVDRLLLKQHFDFETRTAPEDCAKKLGWMHSEARTDDFVGVRSRLSANVTQITRITLHLRSRN